VFPTRLRGFRLISPLLAAAYPESPDERTGHPVKVNLSGTRSIRMSLSKRTLPAIGAATAICIAAGAATLAIAQYSPWQDSPLMRGTSDDWSSSSQDVLGQLGANEGIYVDTKGFKISKGAAKGDASKHVVKLGAREVTDGAIIFRAGDKLYIVDSKPAAAKTQ
jgi:hypothetical protein